MIMFSCEPSSNVHPNAVKVGTVKPKPKTKPVQSPLLLSQFAGVQRSLVPKSYNIHTYIIDGCEYIGNLESGTNEKYITHKGNCRYCSIKNKK